MDLALNDLQSLIYYKTQKTNQPILLTPDSKSFRMNKLKNNKFYRIFLNSHIKYFQT